MKTYTSERSSGIRHGFIFINYSRLDDIEFSSLLNQAMAESVSNAAGIGSAHALVQAWRSRSARDQHCVCVCVCARVRAN